MQDTKYPPSPDFVKTSHIDAAKYEEMYAASIKDPETFIWDRVLESALGADSVLKFEKLLNDEFRGAKYAYEQRNGTFIRQYSTEYSSQF